MATSASIRHATVGKGLNARQSRHDAVAETHAHRAECKAVRHVARNLVRISRTRPVVVCIVARHRPRATQPLFQVLPAGDVRHFAREANGDEPAPTGGRVRPSARARASRVLPHEKAATCRSATGPASRPRRHRVTRCANTPVDAAPPPPTRRAPAPSASSSGTHR